MPCLSSSPQKRRIAVEVPTKVPGQQLCLYEGQQAYVDGFVEIGMAQGFALALLIGDQHDLAGFILELHGAIVEDLEILLVELPAIDERQCEAFTQQGTKLFREIQCQARSPRTITVQKAYGRIQTDGFERGATVVGQQRVEKREQGIDGVTWRTAVPAFELEQGRVDADQLVEHAEVSLSCLTFESAQTIDIGLDENSLRYAFETFERMLKGLMVDESFTVVTPASCKNRALVVDLACEHVPYDIRAASGVVRASILFSSEEHVA